jgi:DNA polymerase III delta subunit
MPKLETKTVYQEWEQGWVWPVYWVYGPERLKARELVRRLKQAVAPHLSAMGAGLGMETLEGSEVSGGAVVECAQTLSLGGGVRLTLVRDAHALTDWEELSQLLGPRVRFEEAPSITVLLSKDLDQRKKFSKQLLEKAAVIECAEVREEEREGWIRHLAKRRGLSELPLEIVATLLRVEPWSLEAVDLELEKLSLVPEDMPDREQVLVAGASQAGGAEEFVSALFERDRVRALRAAEQFASSPEEVLPLLGLLAWNVRQLAGLVGGGAGPAGRGPFMERLRRWARGWTLAEIQDLQTALHDMDRGLKQTPKLGLGYFTELVGRFART